MTLRRVAPTAALVAVTAAVAAAYNDDPAADQVFPAWSAVEPASATPRFNSANVMYEIYAAGTHRAEVHFRNLASSPVHFDYWLAGYQLPGDNERITLGPFVEDRVEVRRTLPLRQLRTGLAAARLTVFDVRIGADTGAADAPRAAVPPVSADEGWMPVCPLGDDAVVRRSNLAARVAADGAGLRVAFRNPSARDLHFAFALPALGTTRQGAARVRVRAGGEASVTVSGAAHVPPSLLRVVVRDVRVGEDTGPLYAVDRSADAGWFPLTTSDASLPLPAGKLLALVDRAGERQARVRFRSRLSTEARFRFVVPGFQDANRVSDEVTIAPDTEVERVVDLDRAADARLALVRLRLVDVDHGDTH